MRSEQRGPRNGDGAELERGGLTHLNRSRFHFDLLPRASFSHWEAQPLHSQMGIITHLTSDENTHQEAWPGSRACPHERLFHFFLPLSLLLNGEVGQGDNEKIKTSFPFVLLFKSPKLKPEHFNGNNVAPVFRSQA